MDGRNIHDLLRAIEVKHEHLHVHDASAEVDGMAAFRNSLAFSRCCLTLFDLCDAIKGRSASSALVCTPAVTKCCQVLKCVDAIVDQVPPLVTVTRFGNPAFQTFVNAVESEAGSFSALLGDGAQCSELGVAITYLVRSFGNAQRIDYGTGHELNFVCFLAVLRELHILDGGDWETVALVLCVRYFELVRKLQRTYHLEPAGSRGCWGLDDYQFLPFLLGACQLSTHPRLRPKSVLDPEIRDNFATEYLYFGAVSHVFELKVASFAEHSPMLYDITAVKDWVTVYRGLLAMYNREVLGKFTIVQHFFYSGLLPLAPAPAEVLALIDEKMPVTAADRRMGPIVAMPEKVVCCSDIIHFPSTLGGK